MKPEEALEQQSRARQQHQRDGDLADDERAPQTLLAGTERPPGGGQQGLRGAGPGRAERGDEATGERRQQRSAERERHHPAVDPNHLEARDASTGRERKKRRHGPQRDQQAGGAASQREDGTFDEQLPHETRPRGPEGDTHGELTPPVRSPREQQVRHIGACHEQNEDDGAREDRQRAPHVSYQQLFEGNDPDRPGGTVRGRLLRQVAADAVELRARLIDGDVRLQPSDHRKHHAVPAREVHHRWRPGLYTAGNSKRPA